MEDEIRHEIVRHLLEYEDEIDGKVMAARDYGSRSKGLESDSSDYDVFFIYMQRPADYALGTSTETYTKTIAADDDNNQIDTEIELHGWSLKKFVGGDGLLGSNPTAIAFCLSPVEYMVVDEELHSMCEHAKENFKPYALMNHYRSLAASNYGKYIEEGFKFVSSEFPDDIGFTDTSPSFRDINSFDGREINTEYDQFISCGRAGIRTIETALEDGWVEPTTTDPTVKRHINIIEALLRSRYIEETHRAPTPMDFEQFVENCVAHEWLSNSIYSETMDLIEKKKSGAGSEEIDRPVLEIWIMSELDREIDPEDYRGSEIHEDSTDSSNWQNHVQRQPDREKIYGPARKLYNGYVKHEALSGIDD